MRSRHRCNQFVTWRSPCTTVEFASRGWSTMSMKTLVFLIALLASTDARAQAPASDSGEGPAVAQAPAAGADLLAQFSGAVEAMVRRVSPTVVQILATSYGINDQGGRPN